MADGSRQSGFPFPRPQLSQLRPGEIIVDLFAGGGGASEALKQALGRDPDIAINHDALAIGLHAANHPLTKHMQDDVWHADPVREVAGRAVGWFHASPARARGADEPVSAITGTGSQQRLTAAHLGKLRGTSAAADATDPLHTISAGGEHHAFVQCTLSPEHEAGALRVAAFLVNYYGNGQARDLREPLDTITTRDRIALVTVLVHGTPYVITDIGLRMLRREELFRAQGFPADYIIDRTANGTPLSISASVRMVGNSVSPPPLCALARANLDRVEMPERMAA